MLILFRHITPWQQEETLLRPSSAQRINVK